jgi:hypothetical protein
MVNSALTTTEMLTQIEKQVVTLKTILTGDGIDVGMRPNLARQILQLIKERATNNRCEVVVIENTALEA